MGWNGSGVFNRLFSWVADKAAGLDISSTRMDADTNDIASSGFGNCLTRDGQGQPTANLPMANFRHTGAGDGVARTDYTTLSQAQDGKIGWTIAGGSADAITATYTPSHGSPTDGDLYCFRATAANATTTPTFAPDSQTARTITRSGGQPVRPGDIPDNLAEIILRYNGTFTRYELLNPAASNYRTRTVIGTGSGTYNRKAGCTVLFVRMWAGGGGGGGGGSGAGSGGTGGGGGATTFGASLTCNGGGGGNAAGGAGGTAGTISGGDFSMTGANGQPGGGAGTASGITGAQGGAGGNSPFGGAGFGGFSAGNGTSATGFGSGGGGGGGPSGNGYGGAGGGSGGYIEATIVGPSATYAYAVGGSGGAGSAGTSGGAGGVGGSGFLIIDEFY